MAASVRPARRLARPRRRPARRRAARHLKLEPPPLARRRRRRAGGGVHRRRSSRRERGSGILVIGGCGDGPRIGDAARRRRCASVCLTPRDADRGRRRGSRGAAALSTRSIVDARRASRRGGRSPASAFAFAAAAASAAAAAAGAHGLPPLAPPRRRRLRLRRLRRPRRLLRRRRSQRRARRSPSASAGPLPFVPPPLFAARGTAAWSITDLLPRLRCRRRRALAGRRAAAAAPPRRCRHRRATAPRERLHRPPIRAPRGVAGARRAAECRGNLRSVGVRRVRRVRRGAAAIDGARSGGSARSRLEAAPSPPEAVAERLHGARAQKWSGDWEFPAGYT